MLMLDTIRAVEYKAVSCPVAPEFRPLQQPTPLFPNVAWIQNLEVQNMSIPGKIETTANVATIIVAV